MIVSVFVYGVSIDSSQELKTGDEHHHAECRRTWFCMSSVRNADAAILVTAFALFLLTAEYRCLSQLV